MDVRVLESVAEVAGLGDAWNRLDADFDTPTLRHDWVLTALEHLVAPDSIRVVCAFDAGELVAAAPLQRSGSGFGRLESAGQSHHGEPCGFVYRDRHVLQQLIGGIAALRLPLAVRGLAAGAPVADSLAAIGGLRTAVRPMTSCPTLDLPADARGVDAVLSASLRSDLRRGRRRAGDFGEASFEMHTPTTHGELERLWSEVLRVEAAGWKGRTGTALGHDQSLRAFFAGYARRAAERKELRVGMLDIDGTAAVMVAVEWDDRMWLLKIGYDERFAAASPGMLLLEGAVSYALDHGLRSVEFLGEAAPWTRRWTRAERPLVVVRSYPRTVRGAASLAAAAVRSVTR